jgi:hypothetical protein
MVRNEHLGIGFRRVRLHREDLLDEALMETFPASDPVAIEIEEVQLIAPQSADGHAARKKHVARSETNRRH